MLAGELGLQGGDPLLVSGILPNLAAMEGSSTVLEELLLPEVEGIGMKPTLLAEGGDGYLVQQVAAKDDHLLLRCVVRSFLRHRVLLT